MSNKVLLLIPNSGWFKKRPWMVVNYAALIITGVIREVCDLDILDANGCNYTEEQCLEKIKAIAPKVVMVPALSVEYHKSAHKAMQLAKLASSDIITIMGGVYVTTMTHEVMEDNNVDYAYIGHAEERLDKFVRLLIAENHEAIKNSFDGIAFRDEHNNIIINELSSSIADIKSMQEPDYSLSDITPYSKYRWRKEYQFTFDDDATIISTSYGCPYNCVFCAVRTITGRHIRFRSPESVIKELEYLINKYNIKKFTFVDDCILFDKKRIIDILNMIIDKNLNIEFKIATLSLWHVDESLVKLLKIAGCSFFGISIESGSDRILKEVIHKPLNKNRVDNVVKWAKQSGIFVMTSWVIGFPDETWEELRETFRYAEQIDSDYATFHIATPLPKTDLYNQFKEKGFIPKGFDFRDERFFGYAESLVESNEFSSFELKVLRAFEWDRINFKTPEKVKKIAKLFNISEQEMDEHRRNTRKKLGVYK